MIKALRGMTIWLILAGTCPGHGTRATIETSSRVVVAAYDDQSPMDGCDVNVYSPADREVPWQTGSTDPNGRFAFCPDTQGVWRVVVDDGMGHIVNLQVDQHAEGIAPARVVAHHHLSRGLGLCVGVVIIFGLFGLVRLIKARGAPCTSQRE